MATKESCHSKLNWNLEKSPHLAAGIYHDLSDPLVVSTDDETIFGGSAKGEFSSF